MKSVKKNLLCIVIIMINRMDEDQNENGALIFEEQQSIDK